MNYKQLALGLTKKPHKVTPIKDKREILKVHLLSIQTLHLPLLLPSQTPPPPQVTLDLVE
jgi:hypothetical protein